MKEALYYTLIVIVLTLVGLSKAIAQTRIDEIEIKNVVLPDNMDSVSCAFSPTAHTWAIVKGPSSAALSHMYAQPYIGDIDNDGHSELVSVGYNNDAFYSSSIVIYDDQLQHLTTITTPIMYVYGGYPIAVADVDRDGVAEIIVHDANGYLHCYRFDGISSSLVWTTSSPTMTGRSSSMVIADINADSIPEIWAMNKFYNAITGIELLSLPEVIGCSDLYNGGLSSMPVFADFDKDGILEFAGGNKVYKLDITNPFGSFGNNATLWKTINYSGVGDGLTSVADIDLDGFLDVVVVKANYMFVWTPYTGDASNPTIISVCPYSSSTPGSRALLTDVNNDGYPEILFTYVKKIVSYRYDLVTQSLIQMWQKTTSDISGATTMSAFDFNQDGVVEIVYRDQSHLRIIDGNTGNNLTVFDCVSPTAVEYPAIVDFDKDGQAEIIASSSNFDINHDMHAQFIVFKSPSNTIWAPARYVWNQHAYNVVGINNDMTVPAFNFNPATAFIDPENNIRRPFNNFLQQATSLDQYGRPYIAAADVAVSNTEFIYENDGVTVTFDYCNQGDKTLSAPYHITAFANHFGGNILASVAVNEELLVDDCTQGNIHFPAGALCGTPNLNSIAIIVNCTSNGIAQNGGLQPECDITNNTAIVFSALFNDTTYLTTSACNQFDWFGETLTQSGDYYHTFTNGFGCDSLVVLNLTIRSTETTHETAVACTEYEWKGNTYYQSGTYEHYEGQTINGCDSIAVLDLTIHTAPPIEILGYTQVAFSSDLWHGIYHYYVVDSTNYGPNSITWSCSNPDWILFPITGFHCLLIAKSQGTAVLMANAVTNMGCNTSASIEINASNHGIGDEDETMVLLFPNPAQTQVTVQAQGLSHIKLFNVFGQIIKGLSYEQTDTATINIDDLSQGIYMVELTTIYGRIIKQLMISR